MASQPPCYSRPSRRPRSASDAAARPATPNSSTSRRWRPSPWDRRAVCRLREL
jgi:hypothetical protein